MPNDGDENNTNENDDDNVDNIPIEPLKTLFAALFMVKLPNLFSFH